MGRKEKGLININIIKWIIVLGYYINLLEFFDYSHPSGYDVVFHLFSSSNKKKKKNRCYLCNSKMFSTTKDRENVLNIRLSRSREQSQWSWWSVLWKEFVEGGSCKQWAASFLPGLCRELESTFSLSPHEDSAHGEKGETQGGSVTSHSQWRAVLWPLCGLPRSTCP